MLGLTGYKKYVLFWYPGINKLENADYFRIVAVIVWIIEHKVCWSLNNTQQAASGGREFDPSPLP